MTKKQEFIHSDTAKLRDSLGKEKLFDALRRMLLIRNFEVRAESAYQQGKIGGFFHAYIGQEAIQTAAVDAIGQDNWFITTYRCHALALLTGATPKEIMAELYGKAAGNAKGRGGSMHLYTDRLLGGFGIVGGHLPVATGAAFSLKYQGNKDSIAICFLGDGAVPQGAVHESLNLASLWDLPCIYVIENNQWGMGTASTRAVAAHPIGESLSKAYGIDNMLLDGMDYFNCYAGFLAAFKQVKETSRPMIIEAVTERFRGHSISDPGLYRTKEALQAAMTRDPIKHLVSDLEAGKMIDDSEYEALNKAQQDIAKASMKYADESPYPDLTVLEEDVMA